MDTDFAAIILVLLYSFILFVGCQQLHTAYNSRNKYISIRNGIVALLTLASFVRVILWIKTASPGTLDDTFMMLIFFLPLWLNFCGLSLLAVFYAKAVNGNKTKWPMRLCLLGNLILLILNVTIATGMAENDDKDDQAFDAFSIIYSSTMDFVLAILLFYYGYKFQIACNESGNALTTWTPNSISIFESINWMLIVIYIFRGIAAAVISQHPSILGEVAYNGNHSPTKGMVVIYFFVTEILPNFCVILMLWRITGAKNGRDDRGNGDGYSVSDGLTKRLLSIEDSKVRIVIGADNEENEENVVNIFGETNAGVDSYLMFSPEVSPVKGTRSSVDAANESLLNGVVDNDNDADANVKNGGVGNDSNNNGQVPVPGGSMVAAEGIDINKYSISAESSFMEEHVAPQLGKGALGNSSAVQNHIDILKSRSSPVIIANKKDGMEYNGGLPLSFGRRGSWNSRVSYNVSKRTPSPMLSEQRLSDGDSDNPILFGSVPIPLGASIGGSASSVGHSFQSNNGLVKSSSNNNLLAAGAERVSSSIKEGDDMEGASSSTGDNNDRDSGENSTLSERYSNTISPRDILLQQNERKQQAKINKGKGYR
jgi:hypothetical protein